MSVRTKTPRTKPQCTLAFRGPEAQAQAAREALHALGFAETAHQDATDALPWRDAFPQWTAAELPGVALAGARHKEGLTQVALAQATGIPQRHISEIERGKRTIGKKWAKTFARVLQVDYRIFL